MKKHLLSLFAILCTAVVAQAQELPLQPTGWNAPSLKTVVIADHQLPATVTLNGEGSYVTVTPAFDMAEYEYFKVEFAEPIAEGTLKLSVNGDNMEAVEIPLEGGISEYEADFDFEFTDDADRTISRFAIANAGSSEVVFKLKDITFFTSDEEQFHPTLTVSTSFSWTTWTNEETASIIPEGGEAVEMWAFGQWGHLQHDFAEPELVYPGETHRFTVTLDEPFPADIFHLTVVAADSRERIYPLTVDGPEFFPEGTTTAYIDITYPADLENPTRNEAEAYTAISIQANNAANLSTSIKVVRQIWGGNRPLSTEQLPIVANTYGDDAKVIDPNPGEEIGPNGLPTGITLPGSWGAIGLWKESFEISEYPAYKIVLRERPADETVQMFYRTHVPDGEGGSTEVSVYVPWETNADKMSEVSDDGLTLTGEFDADELQGTTVEAFALQNMTGNAVNAVLMQVYLQNEDEEWIETPGLGSSISIWNTGSTFPVGGSYDEDGNIWNAYVDFYSTNSALGYYSGTVEEGTYHKVTFYTDEPLPAGIMPMAYNLSFDENWNMSFDMIETQYEGWGTNALSMIIPRSYQYMVVQYFGEDELTEPLRVHFTKIVREVYEGTVTTDVQELATSTTATVKRVEVFNTAGVRLSQPQKGINIIRETLSDGTVRSRKVRF